MKRFCAYPPPLQPDVSATVDFQRLQVQYFCDSDYKGELLRYQQETERFANVWTRRARNERFSRYWQAMSERKLRRQRVIFYISLALENVPTKFQTAGARRDYYHTLLDQLQTEFEHVHRLPAGFYSEQRWPSSTPHRTQAAD